MTGRPDVLVVGAGPTGLTLALQAHDHGATVRIVERRPDPARPSRAMVLYPRTLEVLRPLGVVDALLARADPAPTLRLHLGTHRLNLPLDRLPLPDTAFPQLTLMRQMDVETVLGEALAARGIEVERGTELLALAGETTGARVRLRSPTGTRDTGCGAVIGCDGADSTVRTLSGIGWRGRPSDREIVLADVELDDGLAASAHAVAARRGVLFLFPAGDRATWRLLATRPAGVPALPFGQTGPAVPVDELQQLLDDARLAARITDLAWSTRVPVQHRLADRFRRDRVFLVGDAAHGHSPAAAQGMNTGIQDATNLGWKLAFAAARSAPEQLLDSYELERRPVAQQVIGLTQLVFALESATDPVSCFLRGTIAPLAAPLLPLVGGRRRLIAPALRLLSQLSVNYRRSPLSMDGTAVRHRGPRAGDRLPDAVVTCDRRTLRLHELLAEPGVHVLLDRDRPAPTTRHFGRSVHVHRLTSSVGTGLLAVRPDGYVGYRDRTVDDGRLGRWLTGIGAVDPTPEGP